MSATEAALSTRETHHGRIISTVKQQNEMLHKLNAQISEFRHRTLGQMDPPTEADDAPEPVRHAIEEIEHQLNISMAAIEELQRQWCEVNSL